MPLHDTPTPLPSVLRCSTCEAWKPDEDFSPQRNKPTRRDRHGECKACQRTRQTAYRVTRREEITRKQRERRRARALEASARINTELERLAVASRGAS